MRKLTVALIVALIVLAGFASSPLWGDIIYLKDGSHVEGDVKKGSGGYDHPTSAGGRPAERRRPLPPRRHAIQAGSVPRGAEELRAGQHAGSQSRADAQQPRGDPGAAEPERRCAELLRPGDDGVPEE